MGKYDSFSVARGREGNRLPQLAPQNADQAQLEAALERDATNSITRTTREGLGWFPLVKHMILFMELKRPRRIYFHVLIINKRITYHAFTKDFYSNI